MYYAISTASMRKLSFKNQIGSSDQGNNIHRHVNCMIIARIEMLRSDWTER